MKKYKLITILTIYLFFDNNMKKFFYNSINFKKNGKIYAMESKIDSNNSSEINQKKYFDFIKYIFNGKEEVFKELCEESEIEIKENFDIKEIFKLIKITQKKFVNRSDKQERWEVLPLEWINKNPEKNWECLKKLGFIYQIFNKKIEYDAVCILGAAAPRIKNRINFTEFLIENGLRTKNIILLTGQRYLTVGIDGTDEEILEISKYFDIPVEKLTEANLFLYLYKKSKLSNKNFKLTLIDTHQKNGCRPTTQTTVEDFLKWQKNNLDIENILFVSNQPCVKYQNSIISEIFYNNRINLIFETVGSEYKEKNLQHAIGELGAYIWAVSPSFFRTTGISININFKESVNKLYSHQPLIYQNLIDILQN